MSALSARDLSPAAIPVGTWTVVADACTVTFAVRDKVVGTVHGTFPLTAGTVLTGAHGQVLGAMVALDVAGVATGNAHRDRDLRKPQFLDAAGHPTIVVEAGPTEPGETGWTVQATLSARGASCPIELQVVPTTWDDRQVRVRVTGRLDRTGLGMRVPTFIVGRHLELDVDLVFERA